MQRKIGNVYIAVWAILFALFLAELVLRLIGYRPVQPLLLNFEPAGITVPDSLLGYKFNKGDYTVSYQQGYSFTFKNTAQNGRWCGMPVAENPDTLLILGCSYAFGFGVDDTCTMPYYLQQQLPNTAVVNLATPGYSTVQQLLSLQQWLSTHKAPKKVLLCYASFHDNRNVLSRSCVKNFYRGNDGAGEGIKKLETFHYPKANEGGQLVYTQVRYPMYRACKYSALVNLVDDTYNSVSEKNGHAQETTLKVLDNLAQTAAKNGIELYFFSYSANDISLSAVKRMQDRGVNTHVTTIPIFDKEYTLYPYDPHPNAKAHSINANEIAAWQ